MTTTESVYEDLSELARGDVHGDSSENGMRVSKRYAKKIAAGEASFVSVLFRFNDHYPRALMNFWADSGVTDGLLWEAAHTLYDCGLESYVLQYASYVTNYGGDYTTPLSTAVGRASKRYAGISLRHPDASVSAWMFLFSLFQVDGGNGDQALSFAQSAEPLSVLKMVARGVDIESIERYIEHGIDADLALSMKL